MNLPPRLGRHAIVVAKHTTQPLSAFDDTVATADFFARVDQLITQALVIPFLQIIEAVRRKRPPQHGLTEENQPIQTFTL